VRRPIFESGLPTVKPGVSRSSRNAVTPAKPSSLSIVAKTRKRSLSGAFVTNVFDPSSTYSSPSLRAVVERLNASEPDAGSLIPWAATREPSASPGRYCCFCSSLPKRITGVSIAHSCALRENRSPLSVQA
jgi:hypothetical protein